MGKIRRSGSDQYHDRRVPTKIQKDARSIILSSSGGNYFRINSCPVRRIYTELVKFRSCKRNYKSSAPSFFKTFYSPEEKREKTSNNRLIIAKSFTRHSYIQNGDCGSNFKINHRRPLGMLGGHSGCLLPRPDGLELPQISSLPTQEQNICFSVSSIRASSSPVGIHKGYKTDKVETSLSFNTNFQFLGRLHSFRQIPIKFNLCGRDILTTSSEPRIQNKLGKIKSCTSSSCRISGGNLGSESLLPFSSSGEEGRHHCPLSRDVSEYLHYKETTRKSSGVDELRISLRPIRETPSVTIADLDEHAFFPSFQRQVHSSGCKLQKQSGNLDESRILGSLCSNACSSPITDSDDRCFSGGLVRSSSSSQGSRLLGTRGSSLIDELEGIKGDISVAARIPGTIEGTVSSSSLRQPDSCLVPQETRHSELDSPSLPLNGNPGVLQGPFYCPHSRTSQRSVERSGRPGIETQCHRNGMVSGSNNIQLDFQRDSGSSGGFICNEGQCSSSSVCVSLPRRSSSRVRCSESELEPVGLHLSVSTTGSHSSGCSPPSGLSRQRSDDSSSLADEGMVPSIASTLQDISFPFAEESHSESDDFEGFSLQRSYSLLESSRVATVRKGCSEGLSTDSLDFIDLAHRESTQRQYQSIWIKFMVFLRVNSIAHSDVDLAVVMNFLSYHSVYLKRKYRTIAAYKCALELPLKSTFDINFDDFRLKMYMRGVFNANPPNKSAPMPSWSLNDLLDYLNCERFEPLCEKNITIVSQKLLCLLLLATGRRIDEIGHLSKKHSTIHNGNSVKLCCVDQFVPKHCDSNFKPKDPVIDRLDSDDLEDLRLCPVRAFNTYLGKLGGNLRFSIRAPLWKTDTTGLSKLFSATVLQSRQRLNIRELVPMGPHQARKLAASYSSVMMGSSKDLEKTLMERMGCSSMNVLKKNYINIVPDLTFKCVLPLGTFSPSS